MQGLKGVFKHLSFNQVNENKIALIAFQLIAFKKRYGSGDQCQDDSDYRK